MEDILRDYGLRPQGKSAPMGSSKSLNTTTSSFSFNFNTVGGLNNYNNKKSSPSLNPVDDIFSTTANQGTSTYNSSDTDFSAVYDDVFSGPAQPKTSHSTMGYNDIFQSFSSPTKPSSAPLSGAPRYDDDIFGGVQGVKSSNTMPYDDVFASVGGSAASPGRDSFDDLLGGFSAKEPAAKPRSPSPPAKGNSAFDDLLPGFGKSEPAEPRGTAKTKFQQPSDSSQKPATDPFVVLEADSFSSNASSATFHDPLEEFGMPTESASMNDRKSSTNGTIGIDDIFDGFSQSVPLASSPINNFGKDQSPLKTDRISSPPRTKDSREAVESKSPKIASANNLEKNHAKIYSSDPMADFDIPSGIADASIKSTSDTNKHSLHEDSTFSSNLNSKEASSPGKPNDSSEIVYDRWITVDDIQLFTQPTSAPPPSRLPPPLVIKQGPSKSYREAFGSEKPSVISSIDELEEFAMGRSQGYAQQKEGISSFEEDIGSNSAAAAMKEAMDKAEAKLKTAKKVREKEKEEDMVKARQSERQEREERPVEEVAEREEKERVARVAREAREREEREKEERERERLRTEKERERNKIAVERATKEARERAGIEAREKAQRAAVERATREARERAATEARERAQRAVVEKAAAEARERAAAEARERAAAEARERAERAAAEARERAAAEAKERAERAAVERATAEVRLRAERAAVERATAEVRERAAERASAERAAAAKERQMRNDNDLESFFSMGARPSSAPRQRPATPDAFFNAQTQNKGFSSEAPQKTSAGVPSGIRKASSAANMTDDWTSLFGTPSADEFQEVEGETEERRRARLERHQRTLERTVKALAEKNERDMQVQRDQAERNRFSETLDAEIKRWAAGKEGNLRALLSTLQYVLWPEAGWQPVSLTDVITGASVKKVYRKATLCVHPDKVQQKGATIQQKYIAEKVFDLLKEAWNKFNSEELF
ncbi:hypothetical protein SUGI_0969570 [Cryptomeria japonica]|uniref:auxilin-related protein 1 n=1 Tax=Cryptomeria japonica TaxID=3369 RepID=UPI0024148E58|nr:auxilin-related protein 1 [Cryptomeria japonica]GLJ46023.1 hypothetical protein SUGI_0969570 [Cryptomeria japonica]